jgi:FMN phosphatase YigB (HAD superfamily)
MFKQSDMVWYRNQMTEVYLFDWGDTLMVDFPGAKGKMCDWEEVKAVNGAKEVLMFLSKHAKLYVASGAIDSTEDEIKVAFERAGLDRYISGYFCKSNIGIEKGSSEFLLRILNRLDKQPDQVTMVGDSLQKDIEPAQKLGIKTVWLIKDKTTNQIDKVRKISTLKELCL